MATGLNGFSQTGFCLSALLQKRNQLSGGQLIIAGKSQMEAMCRTGKFWHSFWSLILFRKDQTNPLLTGNVKMTDLLNFFPAPVSNPILGTDCQAIAIDNKIRAGRTELSEHQQRAHPKDDCQK